MFDAAQIKQQPVDLALCLVGRFLTDKSIRVHIMRERLAGIWRPGKGVSIKELKIVSFYSIFLINWTWLVYLMEVHGPLTTTCLSWRRFS